MIEEVDISPRLDPLRVLIVDDDETDCILAADVIETLQWKPRRAHSIEEAAMEIIGMTVEKPPDVILLDMELGPQWGPDLCRRIRNKTDSLYLPTCWIIGFTSHKTPEKIREILTAGANDFLKKPASPEEIEIKLEVARYGHARNRAFKNRMLLLETALAKEEKTK